MLARFRGVAVICCCWVPGNVADITQGIKAATGAAESACKQDPDQCANSALTGLGGAAALGAALMQEEYLAHKHAKSQICTSYQGAVANLDEDWQSIVDEVNGGKFGNPGWVSLIDNGNWESLIASVKDVLMEIKSMIDFVKDDVDMVAASSSSASKAAAPLPAAMAIATCVFTGIPPRYCIPVGLSTTLFGCGGGTNPSPNPSPTAATCDSISLRQDYQQVQAGLGTARAKLQSALDNCFQTVNQVTTLNCLEGQMRQWEHDVAFAFSRVNKGLKAANEVVGVSVASLGELSENYPGEATNDKMNILLREAQLVVTNTKRTKPSTLGRVQGIALCVLGISYTTLVFTLCLNNVWEQIKKCCPQKLVTSCFSLEPPANARRARVAGWQKLLTLGILAILFYYAETTFVADFNADYTSSTIDIVTLNHWKKQLDINLNATLDKVQELDGCDSGEKDCPDYLAELALVHTWEATRAAIHQAIWIFAETMPTSTSKNGDNSWQPMPQEKTEQDVLNAMASGMTSDAKYINVHCQATNTWCDAFFVLMAGSLAFALLGFQCTCVKSPSTPIEEPLLGATPKPCDAPAGPPGPAPPAGAGAGGVGAAAPAEPVSGNTVSARLMPAYPRSQKAVVRLQAWFRGTLVRLGRCKSRHERIYCDEAGRSREFECDAKALREAREARRRQAEPLEAAGGVPGVFGSAERYDAEMHDCDEPHESPVKDQLNEFLAQLNAFKWDGKQILLITLIAILAVLLRGGFFGGEPWCQKYSKFAQPVEQNLNDLSGTLQTFDRATLVSAVETLKAVVQLAGTYTFHVTVVSDQTNLE